MNRAESIPQSSGFALSSRVVAVTLMGGLGNQMFQHAMGRFVAKATRARLVIDARSIRETHDGIGILAFRTGDCVVASSVQRRPGLLLTALRLRLSRPFEVPLRDLPTVLAQLEGGRSSPHLRLQGFFQDMPFDVISDYISNDRPTIVAPSAWFQASLESAVNEQPIAIHFRRGDFSLNSAWGLLAPAYYARAIELVAAPDRPVWIFTDEPQACGDISRALKHRRTVIVSPPEGSPAAESLMLLANCPTIIGSNSTFSFWASALAVGQIILPSRFRPADVEGEHKMARLPGATYLAPIWE